MVTHMMTYWSHSTYALQKFLYGFFLIGRWKGQRKRYSGLIFQKGVPLIFVNNEAKEFVDYVVHSMNRYLGIKQISTGGHNPRSNANVERFMQHLTSVRDLGIGCAPRRLAKYCNGTSSLIHYITGIRSSTTQDRCSIYSTSCIYVAPVQVCPRHCSTG